MTILKSINTVVENLTRTTLYAYVQEQLNQIQQNVMFMTMYPQFFEEVMWGPTALIDNSIAIAARSKLLDYKVGLEVTGQLGTPTNYFVADEAFKELADFWESLRGQGKRIFPYIPIEMFLSTDPDTFQPMISFKSRFGVVD